MKRGLLCIAAALVLAAGTVACGAKQAERNEDTGKEPQTAEEAAALYDELMAQENAIQAENTELSRRERRGKGPCPVLPA